MKKVLFKNVALILVAITIISSCGTSNTEKNSETTVSEESKTDNKLKLIIDIKSIKGKKLKEVEKILGKAESTEKVKGYPCENTNCTRAYFKNGDIEIIFKNKKSNRITINNTPDLTYSYKALEVLGIKTDKAPAFDNGGTLKRWDLIENIYEISFFPNYILIQVSY